LLECNTVEIAIAKLKTGKAPGIDGVMAEHVLNCHRSLSLHLQALFNAIMKHSYVPSEFGIGITIPLLKDNNWDCSDMDNYRAITIGPVLSKIFENCLLSRFSSYFVICDLQCGFKSKVGCNDALSVLCNTWLILLVLVLQSLLPPWTWPRPLIRLTIMHFSKANETSGPCVFLANVNSRSRSLYMLSPVRLSVVCLSVVCNVRAPYSGG